MATRTTSTKLPEDQLLPRIRKALAFLHLPIMSRTLDELIASPEKDLSRLEWLWRVIQPQIATRCEDRIERRIRESKLPARKTLEAFDFNFQPELDRDLVVDLAKLGFIDQGFNVFLAGMSGTGKNHIAMALALNACSANRRVRYTTSEHMLATLNARLADGTLETVIKQYVRPELLVVDEVGLEQVERGVACRAGLMQKVLLPRHIDCRSTILTSNIPWEAWGDYLGDHLGATALLDRLLHHSHVIVINGPSWRDHEHKAEAAKKRAEIAGTSQSKATTKRRAAES
jgi:DNA replication protein DnaC